MGVQVPPFAPQLSNNGSSRTHRLRAATVHCARLAALTCALAVACARSPVDELVDRSFSHLETAADLLERHAGDEKALLEATMRYRAAHAAEFTALREQGERLMAQASEERQREIATAARNRASPLLSRIDVAAQKYPDRLRALTFVRPLVVAATPRLKPGTKPMWVPKELPPLPELPMPLDPSAAHSGHTH